MDYQEKINEKFEKYSDDFHRGAFYTAAWGASTLASGAYAINSILEGDIENGVRAGSLAVSGGLMTGGMAVSTYLNCSETELDTEVRSGGYQL